MTNSHDDDLERLLRITDKGLFVDYQMEKFGKNSKKEGY